MMMKVLKLKGLGEKKHHSMVVGRVMASRQVGGGRDAKGVRRFFHFG